VNYLARLWHYVGRYKPRLVVGVFLGVLSAALNVASLPMIRKVFETLFEEKGPQSLHGLAEHDWLGPLREPLGRLTEYLLADRLRSLVVIMGVLVVLKLLQGLFKGLQEYCTTYVAGHSGIDISNDLYRNVIDLPIGFFGRERNSQVMSRFTNDMYNVEQGLDTIFGKSIREPLNLAGYLFYCLWLAPGLTLISLVVMPFVGLGVVLLAAKAKRGARRALESKARLLGILSESFAGIRIVKVFQGDHYEKERFRQENARLFRQNLKVVKAEAATGPLVEFLLFVGGVLVIVVSGCYVIEGKLATKDVMTLFVALSLALDPLRKLANVGTRYQHARTGAQRIFEYMDMEAEKLAAPGSVDVPKLARSIRFEHVNFSYDGTSPVLSDIDFEVKQGEVVAIVGASGVGKTTLVNLLSRFYSPTSGRILFDGRDIAHASLRSIRRQIGLVTQEVLLFDDTVRANIAYGPLVPGDEERVLAAARAAHVSEFVERMPQGYDMVIGEGGVLLSGGQRQRLAIARAIYKDPAVLILDEATSSLDSESEHLIREALNEFERGRTTFVIAHRLATVERADRIIVLDRGRIEAIGTHRELVDTSDVYRGLYQRQFRDVGAGNNPNGEEKTS
jgi:ABC-type multidrug transport system fused ATPase/permease subunit